MQETALSGWVPAHIFVRQHMNASLFRGASPVEEGGEEGGREEGVRIEVGGGSGAGFQVFCQDTLLVSAGVGGGGGVEGRLVPGGEGVSFSLGGGGGGCIDFL